MTMRTAAHTRRFLSVAELLAVMALALRAFTMRVRLPADT